MRAEEKRIVSSTAYTIGGALLLNGVLQLFVYPQLNRTMGAEALGRLLFIMGIVAILCPSVGQSLNTGRLLLRREMAVQNGDYNLALLLFGGIGIFVSALIAAPQIGDGSEIILLVLLLLLTCFRYYGDVEYRLSLRYRSYFLYYALISAGYLAGYALYRAGGSWYWIFLTGEAAGLLLLVFKGSIFKAFFDRSGFFAMVLKRESFLVLSYLLTNLTLNIDRLFLSPYQGDLAVSQYYVVSLIGKTLVLLTAPINIILISFMTKKRIRLDLRAFLRYAGAGILVALAFFVFAQIGTPVFVRLFYPDLYESVRQIVTLANAGQILGLLSTYLFMVVLTFTEERWQFLLQLAHLLILVMLLFTMGKSDLFLFSAAVMIANAIRIIFVLLLGFTRAERRSLDGNADGGNHSPERL